MSFAHLEAKHVEAKQAHPIIAKYKAFFEPTITITFERFIQGDKKAEVDIIAYIPRISKQTFHDFLQRNFSNIPELFFLHAHQR